MSSPDLTRALLALEGLLDAERHAIREGMFDGLGQLADEKARLIDLVAGHGAAAPAQRALLERIQARTAENQRLLAAAISGVKAAQRRLDMIRRAARTLNTYDAMGRATTIGSTSGTVERRA